MGRQAERREEWRQRVTEQEQSEISIGAYCKQHGLGEHSFYSWRQRLRTEHSVAFALVETRPTRREEPKAIELVLAEGERLLIPCEEATLRMVLTVLRARP
jgi:transposase-like protein